jgi:hypothetical protein
MMTEADWLACTNPQEMRAFVYPDKISIRKMRLLVAALSGFLRSAVFSDDNYRQKAVSQFEWEADHWRRKKPAKVDAVGFWLFQGPVASTEDEAKLSNLQVLYLKELVGPLPFRAVSLDPSWLTPNVVAIAQTLYEGRNFMHLSILADALEEAGCTNADMLNHLRGPGPHVLGCWALDLLLAKE